MINEIIQFLRTMTLSGNKMQRDAAILRDQMIDLKAQLIPFSPKEMEVLSLSYTNKGVRQGFSKSKRGIFNTIFFEPLIAFSVKEYGGGTRLILVATSDREILYFIKANQTQVFFDGRQLGVMDRAGKLYNMRQQVIAEIEGDDNIPTHRVYIKGEDFGFISNPRFENKKENRRAYQMLREMDDDQVSIFLSLTLINLIEESIG